MPPTTSPGLHEPVHFRDAPTKLLPRTRKGKPVNRSLLFEWSNVGCRGVKLGFIQLPTGRHLTRALWDKFVADLTAQAGGAVDAVAPAKRRKGAGRA